MNKFIRVIENSWTDDITFLVPYQVLDEDDHCYLIMDDVPEGNWVEKEYCEEVEVMVTEVFPSERQKQIRKMVRVMESFPKDDSKPELARLLYEAGVRFTEDSK